MDNQYQPPNNYPNSSPLIQNSIPAYSNNQVASPGQLENLQMALKSSAQYVNCPYCYHQGLTRTETACSCCSVMCCVVFAAVPWLLFQVCRGKDINCLDANHYCQKCNNSLASYRAC